jgi:menaquinone-dependent protoporphyrinogen IX oxidase
MTKGGATKEAALAIADALRSKFNLEVGLVNLKKEPSPDMASYRNIVVGAGVKIGKNITITTRQQGTLFNPRFRFEISEERNEQICY